VTVPQDASDVAGWDLQDPRFRSWPHLLRASGLNVTGAWYPVLVIRYRRERFLEPLSRTRVSLDADIFAPGVNSAFLPMRDGTPLEVGVLEVKGSREDLPEVLRPLLRLGLRQRSFSKFLAVYRHVTHEAF
jgi:hypothetical protein